MPASPYGDKQRSTALHRGPLLSAALCCGSICLMDSLPDHPACDALDVPANSSPLREIAHAADQALTLPAPATTRDELTYLRILRDRARLVRQAMREIIADHEIDGDDRSVMVVVGKLRYQVGLLPDDAYDHAPEPS